MYKRPNIYDSRGPLYSSIEREVPHTNNPSLDNFSNNTLKRIGMGLLELTLCTGLVLAGDGTNEQGFVPPPVERIQPPAPPRVTSSAETLLACCCCPVTPMARTEAKKPPQPPVLVTKIMQEYQ
jgi:hypothetical protein